MSETVVGLLGLLTIAAIVVTLFKSNLAFFNIKIFVTLKRFCCCNIFLFSF